MHIKARQDIMLTFSAKTSDAETELRHTQYTLRTDNVLKVASATDIVHPAQLTASQTWRQGSNTWPALEPDATFFTSDAGDTLLQVLGLLRCNSNGLRSVWAGWGASGGSGRTHEATRWFIHVLGLSSFYGETSRVREELEYGLNGLRKG